MATTFPVQIMTPEGAAYEGTAEMVSTRTLVGSIGIRANHEPLMAMLATNDPAGRVPDFGGPEIRPMADLARAWLSAKGKRRAVLPVRVPGAVGANLRACAQLTTEHADGRVTFEQYLTQRARRENSSTARS